MNNCPNCHVKLRIDTTGKYLNCPKPKCGFRISSDTHKLMPPPVQPVQPAQTGLRPQHLATEVWPR